MALVAKDLNLKETAGIEKYCYNPALSYDSVVTVATPSKKDLNSVPLTTASAYLPCDTEKIYHLEESMDLDK